MAVSSGDGQATAQTVTANDPALAGGALADPTLNKLSANWLIIGILAGLAVLCWSVYLLQAILSPFLAGAAVAYLGDPLADRLEARGLSRTQAVVVVFSAFTFIFVLALVIFLPLLFQQLQVVWQKLPAMISWLQEVALPHLMQMMGLESQSLELTQVKDALIKSWEKVGGVAGSVARTATSSGLAFMGFIANVTLIPVVSFYLLKDWDVLTASIQRSLPRRIERQSVALAKECDEVIASFVRGQLLVMLALGVVYSLGLAVVGVDFALLIGMVAGLASIVPYLGTAIGIAAALIVSFFQFHDWLHPLLVMGVFGIGQALEGMVLTPLLVGDKIGLHPVAVIFAVLAGAQLFGFVGMLLALPVAAVFLVVLRKLYSRYLASSLYGASSK